MNDPDWIFAGNASQLSEDEPLSAKAHGVPVGIYKLNGAIHALEDTCPHADALLSQGFVDGEHVECPLHGALFHVATGKCTKGPADRDLMRFETKLDGDRIFVRAAGKD